MATLETSNVNIVYLQCNYCTDRWQACELIFLDLTGFKKTLFKAFYYFNINFHPIRAFIGKQ